MKLLTLSTSKDTAGAMVIVDVEFFVGYLAVDVGLGVKLGVIGEAVASGQ